MDQGGPGNYYVLSWLHLVLDHHTFAVVFKLLLMMMYFVIVLVLAFQVLIVVSETLFVCSDGVLLGDVLSSNLHN